jgi:hypothetical protein
MFDEEGPEATTFLCLEIKLPSGNLIRMHLSGDEFYSLFLVDHLTGEETVLELPSDKITEFADYSEDKFNEYVVANSRIITLPIKD